LEFLKTDKLRLLHLAYQFAMVHIQDSDILGKMAKELHSLVLKEEPKVKSLEPDE